MVFTGVPERMAERVARVSAWDGEDEEAHGPVVVYDDLRLGGVSVPFE